MTHWEAHNLRDYRAHPLPLRLPLERTPNCPGLNFARAQSKFIHFPAGFDQKRMQTSAAAAAAWPERLPHCVLSERTDSLTAC